ncbi:MAG: PA14 domain-containing protein [Halanaerobiales bacterium]
MKKNTVIISLLVLLIFLAFNTVVTAELKTYYQSVEEVDNIINQMKERMRYLENTTIPELRSKVGDLIQVHQNRINDQEEYIEYYKELYEGDEDAFEKRVEIYRTNIEFSRRIISLLQNYREEGLSQINSEGKLMVAKLSEVKDLTWNAGLPSVEVLAGIYWTNFEINKINELIRLAENNKLKGISEDRRDSLNEDYDQRYGRKSSDPGDYWHSSHVVLIEKPLYNALHRLGQEFDKLNEAERQQLDINGEDSEDDSQNIKNEILESAVEENPGQDLENTPHDSNQDDTQDIEEADSSNVENKSGNAEEQPSNNTEETPDATQESVENLTNNNSVNVDEVDSQLDEPHVSIKMSRGTLINLGSYWEERSGTVIHARLNFPLKSGDQIICNQNGYAILNIQSPHSDYMEATVWPESKVLIRESGKVDIKRGFLHVIKGDIEEKIVEEGEGYSIITPSAAIGIQNADLMTYVDEQKNTALFLKEGEIVVRSNIVDQEIILDSGHILIILANGRIAPVEKMAEKDYELFAYNMEQLITPDTIDPLSLKNGLYFTSFQTEGYFKQHGHPLNTSEMNNYFKEENEGINYHHSGIYGRDIDWTEYNKPSYLPDNYYSILLGGYIFVPEDGNYTFAIDSDDASDLFINNELVVSWYDDHNMANNYEQNGDIYLTKGYHLIQIRLEEGRGEEGLRLAWKKPDDQRFYKIPADNFYVDKTDFIY